MSSNTNAVERLGPYVIEQTIGAGSFGDIYLARTQEGRYVVIKSPKKREGMDAKFIDQAFDHEAHALRLIADHYRGYHIIKLLDFSMARDMKYLVLEFMPDGDLNRWRGRNSSIEHVEDDMRLFFTQLLEAIVFLHDLGIAHRDLKPANILLRRSSKWSEERSKRSLLSYSPVLTDFGTAAIRDDKSADFAAAKFQTYAGTIFFMAPEVKEAEHTGNGYSTLADVWSLGVLMLLFFVGSSLNIKASIHSLLQSSKDSMSREFFELLTDMLRPKPSERISWARLTAHPWFRISPEQAYTLLEAQETDEKIATLRRPADIEARHIKFGALSRIPQANKGVHRSANPSQYEFTNEEMLNAVSLSSDDGSIYLALLEARELALNMEAKLRRLHEEWTLDKQRFFDTWLAPLALKRADLELIIATYEPFRVIATQRTLLKFATLYQGATRFSLALEVARVCMDKLKQIASQQGAAYGAQGRTNSGPNLTAPAPSSPSVHSPNFAGSQTQSTPILHISGSGAAHGVVSPGDANFIRPDLARLWEKLFDSARSLLQAHNVRDAEEDANSPISLLGNGTDFPFYAVAHATCKLLYKDCIDWLLPILQPTAMTQSEEDEAFLQRFAGASSPSLVPKTAPKTVEEVILRLKEIRLIMEYVRSALPRATSVGLSATNQSLLSSNMMFGSSASTSTAGGAKRSGSSFSANSSSSASFPLGTSYDAANSAENDRICIDLIDSISKVIQRLPEEMKEIAEVNKL